MAAIASPEFIALCRAQLQLLTQQMAESSAAIYISDLANAETGNDLADFIPVVSYPEPVDVWIASRTEQASEQVDDWLSELSEKPGTTGQASQVATAQTSKTLRWLPLPSTESKAVTDAVPANWTTEASASDEEDSSQASSNQVDLNQELPSETASDLSVGLGEKEPPGFLFNANLLEANPADTAIADTYISSAAMDAQTGSAATDSTADVPRAMLPVRRTESTRNQQLVVPLVYTEVVVGLLVAIRCDRPWQIEEQHHIEKVAHSLAAGCVLERRNQWLQGRIEHKRHFQSRQSEIFHNLLHQFRNPITAVGTFGQLLVKRLDETDSNQKLATGIVRESKRLRELATHFDEAVAAGDADLAADGAAEGVAQPRLPAAQPLLLPGNNIDLPDTPAAARSELGQSLIIEPLHLPDIVNPVVAVAGIVAAEKGVELQVQVATDTPLVWGDAEALGEVVSNLVDNAVKYSPVGAQVWVQTGVSRLGKPAGTQSLAPVSSPTEESAVSASDYAAQYQGIVVVDTGPGIPLADQERLFERNFRGVQAESDIPGTGLGLAIAQSLMEEMRGMIEVISPVVGTPWLSVGETELSSGPGTAFIVWLPEVERNA